MMVTPARSALVKLSAKVSAPPNLTAGKRRVGVDAKSFTIPIPDVLEKITMLSLKLRSLSIVLYFHNTELYIQMTASNTKRKD